ncbi:nuclease (SNase domain protein) [Ferroglobus placidus DSM 10642]|uniref:Nuclease (SNase domain protein) n=1 Tax=Ferroglobus placidus (strain DSM 10642 / AEDII12DO) TaxID=589924 RepID=D3S314_FERPA|nr:thermonuclease family protein [Ferroglobus placidus]ADC64647.1 nuclease (SNase domain protein) [Ferroglobus placidus DSM 10642]
MKIGKSVLLLLFLLLAALLAGCAEQSPQTTSPTTTTAAVPAASTTQTDQPIIYGQKYLVKVLDVIDGDTMDVLFNGKKERVRFLGVDTPEKSASDNKPYEYDSITDLQCLANWGMKAKEFTGKLEGKYVYIEFDELAGLRGYYGRLLAYVYLQNGTDFTAELVKKGYARAYTEGEFKKEQEYVRYQEKAMAERLGLWSCMPAPTTTATPTPATTTTTPNCDPSYPDVCIPPPPPDLDCKDIPYRNFRVLPPDPHHFDGDGDGIGCES